MADSQVLVQTKVFPREESQSSPTPQPALSNKIPAVRWTYPTTKWILPRTIQGKKMSPSPVPLYGRHKSPDSTPSAPTLESMSLSAVCFFGFSMSWLYAVTATFLSDGETDLRKDTRGQEWQKSGIREDLLHNSTRSESSKETNTFSHILSLSVGWEVVGGGA